MFRILCFSLYMLVACLPSAHARDMVARPDPIHIATTLPMLQHALAQHLLPESNAVAQLLASNTSNAHAFSYSPHHVQLLMESDVLIVFDERILETNLQAMLAQYKGTLIRITDLEAGILSSAANADTPDPHFWLSPATMRRVLIALGQELSAQFPQLSASIATQRIAIDTEFALLQNTLLGAQRFAAIPYHDAYLYVIKALKSETPPLFSTGHHLPISARQLSTISDYASTHPVGCVLVEPHSSAQQMRSFAKAHNLLLQPFDPFGLHAKSYRAFIEALSKRLSACHAHASQRASATVAP